MKSGAWEKNLQDYRFYCLAIALLTMLILLVKPQVIRTQPVYNFTFIVDITRSMNARDYQQKNETFSRLQYVKQVLHELVIKLPCQSKVGLGVFTERKSTLLFQPIEVCSSFSEIDTTINAIDWRMAWAADSRISKGITSIIEQIQDTDTHVVFFTDGQEAPPVNPRYKTDFSHLRGRLKGVLVGVGGLHNVPIPKINSQGQQQGVYKEDDVPQRSTFGIAPVSSAFSKGYNARNAPFGDARVGGDQHLTRVYEPYLQQLSKEVGWSYHRLETSKSLSMALQAPQFSRRQQVLSDIRYWFAVFALVLLSLVYIPHIKWFK